MKKLEDLNLGQWVNLQISVKPPLMQEMECFLPKERWISWIQIEWVIWIKIEWVVHKIKRVDWVTILTKKERVI